MSAVVGACVVQNNPQGRTTPLALPQTECEEFIWDHHYYCSDHNAADILGHFSGVVYKAKVLKKGILQEQWICGTGKVGQLFHMPTGKPIFGSGCLNTNLTHSPQKCLKTSLFSPELNSLRLCSQGSPSCCVDVGFGARVCSSTIKMFLQAWTSLLRIPCPFVTTCNGTADSTFLSPWAYLHPLYPHSTSLTFLKLPE